MSSSVAGSRTLPFRERIRYPEPRRPWHSYVTTVLRRARSNETLRRLVEMPLTVLGAGCFSTAAFIGNEIAGFAVTGVCLVVLELMVADVDEGRQQ